MIILSSLLFIGLGFGIIKIGHGILGMILGGIGIGLLRLLY